MIATAPYADEVLISRGDLLSGPIPNAAGPAAIARGLVAAASTSLQLLVENADRGRTVDGWLGADGLVWHVRGDEDTARSAIITPLAHLGPTVARMVGLGPRIEEPREDVTVPIDVMRKQLSGAGDGLPGGLLRVWSLNWATDGTEDGMTVVDQGDAGCLWAVTDADGQHWRLRAVTPLQVWLRLTTGTPAAQPSVGSTT